MKLGNRIVLICKKIIANFIRTDKEAVFGGGENVFIGEKCEFGHPENIVLGSNIWIGDHTNIYAQGKVIIKDGTILADHVDIRTANHYYDGEDLNLLPFDEKILIGTVTIEENVWIASHCVILPGVTIGEGAVIAAGSIVTKSVEPMSVVAGNPAKIVKYRDRERYEKLRKQNCIYMKEYDTLHKKKIEIGPK